MDMIKGLLLVTRTAVDPGHLKAFLAHHLQFCEKALVQLNYRPKQDPDAIRKICSEFGERIILDEFPCDVFSNRTGCTRLSTEVAKLPEFELLLHLDRDEFIAWPAALEGLAQRIRSGESDYAEGRMVCRFAPGGKCCADELPSYAHYREAAPVRSHVLGAYGDPNLKVYLTRNPHVFIHAAPRDWKKDKQGMILDHFRWTDKGRQRQKEKMSQHPAGIQHSQQWRDKHVYERTEHFKAALVANFRPYSLEIEGWMDYQDIYKMIASAADEGGTFVELGIWQGRSLSFMCEFLTLLEKRLSVFAYDSFDPAYRLGCPGKMTTSEQWRKHVEDTLAETSPWLKPTVVRANSWDAAALHEDGSVFAVWVDGCHTREAVIKDIEAWLPKIRPGGILAGHDLDHNHHPGVRQGLEAVGLRYAKISKTSWIHHVPK